MLTRWRWQLAFALCVATFLTSPLLAQGGRGGRGGPQPMLNRSDDPLLRNFAWREIGPIGQGGRVDDIEVVASDTRTYYVGFATAGVFKTGNNGTTFEQIFDRYGSSSIGDIGLSQSNPDVVYVGTGEPNNRQSSSIGDGIYKSTDGGATFTHVGLRETQTIARVVVHPTNPDVVWVAANGKLYGPNPERGVFKSTDGGRTWNKVLYVDENTGATELIIDPSNPNNLWAATYQRRRSACCFVGGGPGSGLWASTDGGQNWTRLEGNGLPRGTKGRIALTIGTSNPNVIYAQIEVGPDKEAPRPEDQQAAGGGGRGGVGCSLGRGGGGGRGRGADPEPNPNCAGVWKSTDKGRTWTFLNNQNARPMYFSQIRVDPTNENIVYTGGVSAYKSTDGGRTFSTMSGLGHVDHHAIWVHGDHVIYGNDGSVDVSYDGGDTWESLRRWSVAQPYHVSVDMRRPYWVCTGLQDNGSWCGPSSNRSGALLAWDWFSIGGGDGFYSQIDPTDPYIIYTESQNGNINRYNVREGTQQGIRPNSGRGGRGGGGGGRGGGGRGNIVPEPGPDVGGFQFHWNSPMLLSPHNPSTIFFGGNRLFISYDRGDTWRMSPDLSKQIDRDTMTIMGHSMTLPSCGNSPYGSECINARNDGVNAIGMIITIDESPLVPGVIWAGTDDGNIQVSRDAGHTWTEVGRNIPGGTRNYYVSRVDASHADPATVYVSLDGHRSDDYRPHVYVSRDWGQTWTSISSNLPEYGNVNTVRQDPVNPSLLYAGTEFNFFVSLDEGQSWKQFNNNLATARIDDVVVHPRDNDLVLATHARGIQVMDDITPLQQLTPEVINQEAYLFQPREAVRWKTDRTTNRSVTGDKHWEGQNAPPGTTIHYYLRQPASGNVTITITDLRTGETFREINGTNEAGMNCVRWNLAGQGGGGGGGRGGGGGQQPDPGPPPPPPCVGGGGGGGGGRGGGGGGAADPGPYRITLNVGGREFSRVVEVVEDIWLDPR
jgi:photosystem II stability/assembly factor-like uncharacterized protein